jgi:alpha-beta hydrolase superfamily lysophospholipase
VRSIELEVDVTEAAGLDEPAALALTVTVPDTVPGHLTGGKSDPVVCFAKPGAGYSRRYFTEDLPGPGRGAQADWHAQRGWIVVSVDHLGVGDSSQHDPLRLSYGPVVAASEAAETEVRQKLAAGTLVEGLGPMRHPVTIGIGQSMGGSLTVIQQGRYHSYDGIGVLGYSAVHTHPPTAPGTPPLALPWVPRDTQLADGVVTNAPALAEVDPASSPSPSDMAWGFHYDDVDPEVVARDMTDFPARRGELPPWGSATIPATVAMWCVTPGGAAAEAAAVRCPVLVALGERDVLVDPRGEVRAYLSAPSVDFFVCPRMAHMHNFAGTRELLWRRIETWAEWVRAFRDAKGGGGETKGAGDTKRVADAKVRGGMGDAAGVGAAGA